MSLRLGTITRYSLADAVGRIVLDDGVDRVRAGEGWRVHGEASDLSRLDLRLLVATAGSWQLLLQLDSDDEMGTCWGDVGRLYFWIRRDHLRAGAFDEAWCILQCT